ncbi:MAG: 3' terminal RNA ribose 2'-O-methyltransferase Hen1 [Lentisphaerae bacterium]|nr:3' terminal RNA ribose 2'-O-methyltransferase Hen1 [Lentisphaerota bacterium]
MLLTITTTYKPATDLGYLLHKNPAKCQEFEMTFGKAYVFFPEATQERCTAALLLDVDPVGLVRGRRGSIMSGLLDQYVNDRPYAASSLLSVAMTQVFGSALRGQSNDRPELAGTAIPLTAKIPALPCRHGGDVFLRHLFEPLGYKVEASRLPLDETFPDWGEGPYFAVEIEKTTTLKDLLTHLYVLIPVLDDNKHYYVGDDEVEKLLRKGEGWLASHPEKEAIARRYLKYQPSLAREALARLVEEEDPVLAKEEEAGLTAEEPLEKDISLNEARLGAVMAALKGTGAKRILDLGCGEGKLLRELLKEKQFEQITGMDVSVRSLETAHERLRLDRLPARMKDRLKLMHGSLLYRDRRLEGFDAAAVVEVIEHLDPPRLAAAERAIFECAKPRTVVLTTPNVEYNVMWKLAESSQKFRHGDHRFEWTRQEFQAWANGIANRFGYKVTFLPVGPEDATVGSPTQMGVFRRD